MRLLLKTAVIALALAASAPEAAAIEFNNPDGVGIFTPAKPFGRRGPRLYRHDPYSWYHKPTGYYPYYSSRYWAPRSEMRYRYRYVYYGPKYTYYPSWGYPFGW